MTATVSRLDDRRDPPKILGAVQLVRKHSKASGSARSVLNVLATYADRDGGSLFVGRTRLENETGLSRSTCRRAIRKLEELGELVTLVHGFGDKPSRYRITLSPDVSNPVDNPTYSNGTRVQSEPGGGSNLNPGRVQSDPLPERTGHMTGEGGPFPDHCPDHRTVEDPPPCRKCQKTREANAASRLQLAKSRDDDERRRRLEADRAAIAADAARARPAKDSPAAAAARRALRKPSPNPS